MRAPDDAPERVKGGDWTTFAFGVRERWGDRVVEWAEFARWLSSRSPQPSRQAGVRTFKYRTAPEGAVAGKR